MILILLNLLIYYGIPPLMYYFAPYFNNNFPKHSKLIAFTVVPIITTWILSFYSIVPFSDVLKTLQIEPLLINLMFIIGFSKHHIYYNDLCCNEFCVSNLLYSSVIWIIIIILTILIAIIKNVYEALGPIYEDQLIALINQGNNYKTNTKIIFPFIQRYLFNLFLPSLLFALLFHRLSHLNLKFIFKFYSVKVQFRHILIFYILSTLLLTNKLVIPTPDSSYDFLSKNSVVPSSDLVIPPKKLKNIIFINLEAMETMYLSKENGGLSNVTLLPYLEGLMKDKENTVTFSNLNDKFGGHITLKRSSFTVAATVGTICGYPYLDESFYEKMHCLPSILHDFGYELHMIKGTSITDWGVGRMFAAHHFDNLTLKDDIVPNTKENWLNDHLTWMKYREDLDKLGKLNKPFYSHFFTLDSHEPGMKCPYCPKDGTVQENAVRCVDNHVKSFMEWAKDQSWYNNTLFVLVGDHLVRGFGYKERAEANHYSRRSVNIFYHSEIKPLKATNREYSILDYFPTILAAAGFKIKKDQLGVGVNLFSNKKTKLEEYGLDTLQTNLESTIKFYNEIVLGKPKECRFNEPCIDVKITQMI